MSSMLLALALVSGAASPAPALPAAAKDAALVCAKATVMTSPDAPRMRLSAQVSHYLMLAAQASPGTKPFLERTVELGPVATGMTVAAEDAAALVAQCDHRFPAARGAVAVALPADAFERDVTCFATLALLRGAAETVKEGGGDASPLDRIEVALKPFSDRMTDAAIAQHNITTQVAFNAYMSARLQAMLPKANPEYVARACGLAEL